VSAPLASHFKPNTETSRDRKNIFRARAINAGDEASVQRLRPEICAAKSVVIELQRGGLAQNVAVKCNLNVDKK
jgi:hypothetical protein